MARTKSAEAIKFMLRIPPPLMKRLQKQAEQNNTSVTQEIINQLDTENQAARQIAQAVELLRPTMVQATKTAADVAATIVLAAFKDAARPAETEIERRLGQLQEALARAAELTKRTAGQD
jgi:hypothetical protein